MRSRRFAALLVTCFVLLALPLVYLGCNWFDDDEAGGNGPTTSKYVVVANTYGLWPQGGVGGNLSVFKINSNGTLTFQDNVDLLPGENEPTMIALHPNKKFVYVASQWSGVTKYSYINVFSFNDNTGALTEIFTVQNPHKHDGTLNLAFTPDGKFLYTTDPWWSEVQVFGVDNTSGALEYLGFYGVEGAHGIAMHPTGKFLFVGGNWEYGNGELFAFEINTATGELTPAPGSPLQPRIGEGPYGAWVWLQTTYDGNYLFGAGARYGGVWGIDNVTGQLTELHLENQYYWRIKTLVVTPTLPFLYVAGWDNNSIAGYKANQDGSVDNVVGSPFAAGENPKSLTVTGDSKYLYVANYADIDEENGSVMAYSIARSTGVLTKIGTYKTPYTQSKNLLAIP